MACPSAALSSFLSDEDEEDDEELLDELLLEEDSVLEESVDSDSLSFPFAGADADLPWSSDAAEESAVSVDSVVVSSDSASVVGTSDSVASSVVASVVAPSSPLSLFEKPGPTATIKSDASALQTAATRNCFHQTVRLAIPSLPLPCKYIEAFWCLA